MLGKGNALYATRKPHDGFRSNEHSTEFWRELISLRDNASYFMPDSFFMPQAELSEIISYAVVY